MVIQMLIYRNYRLSLTCVLDLIKYINESAQNYRKAVQDVNNAMNAIRNKTENRHMEAVSGGKVYQVDMDLVKYTSATTCPPGTMYERNVCGECALFTHTLKRT